MGLRVGPMLVLCALVVGSCGGDSTTATPAGVREPTATTQSSADASATVPDAAAVGHADGGSKPGGDDVVRFVAALDEALAGTDYAGEVLESPEVFVATARLFCERLEAGVSPDLILGEYVETLTGVSIDEAGDEEIVLAGSLLGVGVGSLCVEHISLVEGAG